METNTIEQIAESVSKKYGFKDDDYKGFFITSVSGDIDNYLDFIKDISEQYAYQKCEEQIKRCSEGLRTREPYVGVHQEKVLKTPNVCNPKTD